MTQTQPDGFLALPATKNGPGVLVLHAWWGLNDTIQALCRRLANAGFVAFAPDLYHGKIARTIPEAEALSQALEAHYEQVKSEVADAARFLAEKVGPEHPDLGVIGFSLGATYALGVADSVPEHIARVVVFYGSWGDGFSRSRAAYQGHFAENDPYESPEGIAALESALEKAGRPVTIHHYPGTGHWFFEPDRPEAYDAAAAALAWERTLAFLSSDSAG